MTCQLCNSENAVGYYVQSAGEIKTKSLCCGECHKHFGGSLILLESEDEMSK